MSSSVSASGLGNALNRSLSVLLFAVAPVVVTVAVLAWTFGGSTFLSDFHGDLYNAGVSILNGQDPYRAAFLAHLAGIARAGGHPNTTFAVPVYPAPALLAMVPLALLPYKVAGVIFTILGVGALVLGLRLFGVRDWRCYGAAFLSWPVLHTLRLGQVNEFLILAAAIAWRWRPRAIVCGLAVAWAVVAKVFLWPLGLFLLLTRRWRALAAGVLFGIAVMLIAWAVIGFASLSTYPGMLSDLSAVEGTAGISLLSLAGATGVAHGFATAASVLITLALVGLAWLALRIDGGERSAFGLLVVAGLTSSSLVWPHYLTLLFVPIALLSPTFGPLWLVPLLAYLAPVELTHGNAWRIGVYLAIELVVALALVRPLLASRRGALPSADRADRLEGERATGRLVHGLRSTSFRSYPAAQRPTKGS
jgi:alpha-1,2-mannosyltransferase